MPADIRETYQTLIDAWNERDADMMASCFTSNGTMVGFDGSTVTGRDRIAAHLEPIFRDHPTAAFVTVVREVREIGVDVALLRAIVGMVPPGADDINPETNASQCLVASRDDGEWLVELFQNTPAAYHGRPEAQEAHSAMIRKAMHDTA
jgi:uncharacterized protein (TIGR02246 family)